MATKKSTAAKINPKTPETPVQILKEGTCPTSSGKSNLGYQIGGDDSGAIQLRVASNDGGGFFSKVILINSLFVGAIFLFGFAWANRVRVAMAYQDELIAMNPARLEIVESWLIPAAVVAITVVTLACFKFMWDVRHPKAE
jgi:hypothetical protein